MLLRKTIMAASDKPTVSSASNEVSLADLDTIPIGIRREDRSDGSILLMQASKLGPYPHRYTGRLLHWANVSPGKIFIAQRNEESGGWETLTYAQTLSRVRSIAQALLYRKVSTERPIAILSENSIEHALIGLAALHIGIPYSPVTPAYSLRSGDFKKLRSIWDKLTPGLVFVNDAKKYGQALNAVARGIEIVSLVKPEGQFHFARFDELLSTTPTDAVEHAYGSVRPNTIAKILFTSGSTGMPKGVINTHENLNANLQQITQTYPFLNDEGLEVIDWLPWSHTFGGNHNFGPVLYNGGSFYIDDGNPGPDAIGRTVGNLRGRKPTVYFNVPRGFEALLPFFKNDGDLRRNFFSNLKMLFYAGAGLYQHVWDEWQDIAIQTTGKRILFAAGLGCTESSPAALLSSSPGDIAGLIGIPAPGLELKLVPKEGKMEARYRGKNIFPSYWRDPEQTERAFDEEGFFCTGDTLKFVDEHNANKGMLFDGRLTEDFKLSTGTWVSAGALRAQLVSAGKGLIQDVVVTGHDRGFVGAIVFPEINYCRSKFNLRDQATLRDISVNREILTDLKRILEQCAARRSGSSTFIRRAVLADFTVSAERGEVTDKGSLNARTIIENHPELLTRLYSPEIEAGVVEAVRGG